MTPRDADTGDSQSVDNSIVSGHVVMVGHATGDINIRLGKQDYYIHPLGECGFTSTLPERSKRAPSYLLDALREVVPYTERVEQSRIIEWCDDGEIARSVMLLSGVGGSGKTRLARHVATTMARNGWDTVEISRIRRAATSSLSVKLAADSRPVLAIVDYADRWPLADLVEAVSEILSVYSKRDYVRLLLLGRSTTQWEDVAAALDALPLDIAAAPLELGAFTDERNVGQLFDAAVAAFARTVGVEPPAEEQVPTEPGSSALSLHMTALAWVLGYHTERSEAEDFANEEVSTFLLRHERRYWQSAKEIDSEIVQRLVFLATLVGPTAFDEAMSTVKALGIHSGDEACRKAVRIHRDIYPLPAFGEPETDFVLAPLRPDRLGEDLIAECLKRDDQARVDLGNLFGLYGGRGLDGRYAARLLLDNLSACAVRHTHVRNYLWHATEQWPHIFQHAGPLAIRLIANHADVATRRAVFAEGFGWEDAASAAIVLGAGIIDDQASLTPAERVQELLNLVDLYVAQSDWDRARKFAYVTAELVANEEFDGSDELRAKVSAWLGTQEIGSADAAEYGPKAIAFFRSAARSDPSRYRMPLAGQLANYSWVIHERDGVRAALAISEEAVHIVREHFDERTSPLVGDMIARAAVFQNHGLNLLDSGDPQQAVEFLVEPVEIWSALYDIDWPHSSRSLTSALDAVSRTFEALGAADQAIESAELALEVWRGIAEGGRDPKASSHLIQGLSSLAVKHLKAGKPEAALRAIEEALELESGTSENLSGSAAVSINLRINRGSGYSMLGRYEAAVDAGYEAVAFADQAIRVEERAPASLMAVCLFNLGNCLRGARRLVEAELAYEMCVDIGESTDLADGHGQGDVVLAGAKRALSELRQRGVEG